MKGPNYVWCQCWAESWGNSFSQCCLGSSFWVMQRISFNTFNALINRPSGRACFICVHFELCENQLVNTHISLIFIFLIYPVSRFSLSYNVYTFIIRLTFNCIALYCVLCCGNSGLILPCWIHRHLYYIFL